MSWFLAVVIFITSWVVLLFILLPIGIVREDNPIPGQPLSAPKKIFLKQKMLINTVLSLLVTAGFMWLYTVDAHASESPLNKPAGNPSTNSAIVYPTPTPSGKPSVNVVPCRDRVPATPSADLVYQGGVDTHGKRIVPADLGGHAAATHDLENPQIPLYAPLTGQPQIPGNGNEAAAPYAPETYANFGNIEVVNGQALLNGQPLTPPDACPN